MKKAYRFLFICSLSLVFSVLIQSCCTDEWLITGGGELRLDGSIDDSGKVNQPFNLSNYYEADLVYEGLSDLGLIQTAMATSCEYGFQNKIVSESISLSIDRSFSIGSETISAGSNLLDLIQFNTELESVYAGLIITINNQFFSDATLEKGEHTFLLESETEDGLKLESRLVLDLDF